MKPVDLDTLEQCMTDVLKCLNLRVGAEGLKDTPRRVARYLAEFRNEHNYGEILGEGFEASSSNLVTQSKIPFRGMCEHHLAPMMGHAAIGYVPNKKVVGLSKLTRLVDAVGTERPSLQEHITTKIANILDEHIEAKGVIVVTKAEHACMACRGVARPGVITTCSTVKGLFMTVPPLREEFFHLIGS